MSEAVKVEVPKEAVGRPTLSPVVRALVEKLQTPGKNTRADVAKALQDVGKALRDSQKEGWKLDSSKWDKFLEVETTVVSTAKPLMMSLAHRLSGLYTLYESFDSSKAQALTPLIEEVSQALVDVASIDEKDTKEWNPVLEKAGLVEQKAADRLT